jgi:hypothetical protein
VDAYTLLYNTLTSLESVLKTNTDIDCQTAIFYIEIDPTDVSDFSADAVAE